MHTECHIYVGSTAATSSGRTVALQSKARKLKPRQNLIEFYSFQFLWVRVETDKMYCRFLFYRIAFGQISCFPCKNTRV